MKNMKKKLLIILVISFFVLLGGIVLKKIQNNNINNNLEPYNYYAKVFDYNTPGKTYILKLWEKGWYELEIQNHSSAVDGKTNIDKYEGYLELNEMQKVKGILEYLNKKYPNYYVYKNDNIIYYIDFTSEEGLVLLEDNAILEKMLQAIVKINKGNNEEGNRILDEILIEINK